MMTRSTPISVRSLNNLDLIPSINRTRPCTLHAVYTSANIRSFVIDIVKRWCDNASSSRRSTADRKDTDRWPRTNLLISTGRTR